MTDLAIRPDADAEHGDADDTLVDAETAVDETPAAEPEYQWAPADEAPKKRRVGMWVGIAAGVTAVAVAASSLVLIAPGTAVAGAREAHDDGECAPWVVLSLSVPSSSPDREQEAGRGERRAAFKSLGVEGA